MREKESVAADGESDMYAVPKWSFRMAVPISSGEEAEAR